MTTYPARSGLLYDPGLRSVAASSALVAALLIAAAVRLGPLATELLVATVVGVSSVALTKPGSLGVGALGWSVYTGFVEHRYGELTFTSADLVRLAALLALAVTVAWGTSTTMTEFSGEPSTDVLRLNRALGAVPERHPRR